MSYFIDGIPKRNITSVLLNTLIIIVFYLLCDQVLQERLASIHFTEINQGKEHKENQRYLQDRQYSEQPSTSQTTYELYFNISCFFWLIKGVRTKRSANYQTSPTSDSLTG